MPAKSPKGPKDAKCPKCGDVLEEGLVLDRGPYYVALKQHWTKGGVVEFSLKTGLKTTSGPLRTIATWRCKGCGFLESYAR